MKKKMPPEITIERCGAIWRDGYGRAYVWDDIDDVFRVMRDGAECETVRRISEDRVEIRRAG